MSFCCSQCDFTAQFESALLMHRQLHHESSTLGRCTAFDTSTKTMEKWSTLPRVTPTSPVLSPQKGKGFRLPGRTSSATRLFNNIKMKISKSRMLFSHPEESLDSCASSQMRIDNRPSPSDCTSKALKVDSIMSHATALTALDDEAREMFGCHLCPFEADRITVLDRHLLNDHKIGLENLLKLVMAKTKDGLTDDNPAPFDLRKPYYKPQDEILEEGEFIIETVAPKVKILKHASTNTETNFGDIDELTSEIDNFLKLKQDGVDVKNARQTGGNLMSKMAALNQYMCKFVDSSNTIKKVLNIELDSNEHLGGNELTLGLGDRETPREWERAHSEKMERCRKYGENVRGDKAKKSVDNFYF